MCSSYQLHEIIQDISESEGNPPHRGQKVAGIKTNFFKNIRVVNNIVVTREYAFFAMQLQNQQDGGTIKEAKNNIFVNGKLPGYTNSSGTYVTHNWVTENNQIISNVEKNNQRTLVSENNKSLEKNSETLERKVSLPCHMIY